MRMNVSRSPLGLRGLKCIHTVWDSDLAVSRSPLGLRGLKCWCSRLFLSSRCRSPLGLRGLKFVQGVPVGTILPVAALLGCVD